MRRLVVICTEQTILGKAHSAFSTTPMKLIEDQGISYSIPRNGTVLSLGANGLVFAASHCTKLLCTFRPDLVIHFGTAGAVGRELNIGTLVRVAESHQWDLDCSALGFPQGVMPRAQAGTAIPADGASLCHHTRAAGVLLSGNQFVDFSKKPTLLEAMIAKHSGSHVLVDMEGFAVDQACQQAGVDCLQLRVVLSNESGQPADYNATLQKAAGTCAREMLTIIQNFME